MFIKSAFNKKKSGQETWKHAQHVYIFDMFPHLTCLMVFTGLACSNDVLHHPDRENVEIWTYSKAN